MVPIRSTRARPARSHRARTCWRWTQHDRYLRFGYAATDEQIQRYVDGLDFDRDEIFGIYNRRLELHRDGAPGLRADRPAAGLRRVRRVRAAKHARGRGYGARLFERAVMHARNEGVGMLFIHALSENTAMLKIARNAGATRGAQRLRNRGPPAAAAGHLDSRMSEIALQQLRPDRLPAQDPGQAVLGLPGRACRRSAAACATRATSRPLSRRACRSHCGRDSVRRQ